MAGPAGAGAALWGSGKIGGTVSKKAKSPLAARSDEELVQLALDSVQARAENQGEAPLVEITRRLIVVMKKANLVAVALVVLSVALLVEAFILRH
jgi:hypothetical protein